MTNHKAPGLNSISIFMILLLLAVVYNFGCVESKKNRPITNVPNKAAADLLAGRQAKPTSGRPEDSFIYRQIVSLEFSHKMVNEAFMFFLREAPDCQDVPPAQRTQNLEIRFETTVLSELARILRASFGVKAKGQYSEVYGPRGNRIRLEFKKEPNGKIQELVVRRTTNGPEQTVAKFIAGANNSTRIEFEKNQFVSSVRVSFLADQNMACDIGTDTQFMTENFRCQNLGQGFNDNQESIILTRLDFSKSGDPGFAGSATQYRNSRPSCPGDKPLSFAVPRNSQIIQLFLNHNSDTLKETQTVKPVVDAVPTPTPSPAPRGRRAGVRASLDGAELPESETADAALNGLSQTSPVSAILDSPGAVEALKNQAIHDKGDSEPVPGAPVFNDPSDLNGVDLR